VQALLRRLAADPPARAQLCSYLDKYNKAIIVHADNVGSNQLMMIRKARAAPQLLACRRRACRMRGGVRAARRGGGAGA
jgi:hypothetical protein